MKKLILIRHAAFSHENSQMADVNCPLTRLGRRQASEMACQFAKLGLMPDLFVCSTALRARETAEIYAKTLGVPSEKIQVKDGVFEAERVELIRAVQAFDDAAETVLLVAHHPGTTLLLKHFVDSDIEKMPLGAFAVLELSAESWRMVSFKKGQILEYAAPKGKGSREGWWRRFASKRP